MTQRSERYLARGIVRGQQGGREGEATSGRSRRRGTFSQPERAADWPRRSPSRVAMSEVSPLPRASVFPAERQCLSIRERHRPFLRSLLQCRRSSSAATRSGAARSKFPPVRCAAAKFSPLRCDMIRYLATHLSKQSDSLDRRDLVIPKSVTQRSKQRSASSLTLLSARSCCSRCISLSCSSTVKARGAVLRHIDARRQRRTCACETEVAATDCVHEGTSGRLLRSRTQLDSHAGMGALRWRSPRPARGVLTDRAATGLPPRAECSASLCLWPASHYHSPQQAATSHGR